MRNLLVLIILCLISTSAFASGFIYDRSVLPNASFTGPLSLNNEISPPAFSSDQDDYSPTGIETTNYIRLTSTGNNELHGLQPPSPLDNRLIVLTNVGGGDIKIKNEDGGSSINYRFSTNGDVTFQTNESVIILYDATSLRWRIIARFD